MRTALILAVIVAAFVLVPTALADTVFASGSSTAQGYKFSWSADYNTATNDLIFDCVQVSADTGQPLAAVAGELGGVTITLANGQQRTFDCFGQGLVNLGPQTQKVNLKVDTVGRWSGFTLHTWFSPPPS